MTLTLFGDEPAPTMWEFEDLARRQGYRSIAGIDEAGRGPLAGPVVAAAVILDSGSVVDGINDSKKLTEKQREGLFDRIMATALAVGVGIMDHDVVDRDNILQATLAAMKQAVAQLATAPDFLLIDGISMIPLAVPQRTIKQGDGRSVSIAAASIIAKVTRDRMMVEYDRLYPGYGLAGHKGYGSQAHLEAIARLGPSPIHRTTFRGVREHVRSGE
ncbi:ribonuclease HII [Geobacter argillaceus]|uniref:Ribonuclease HII n=1 Tax=Geobacter argillaceus TaxID=345631 RepID=A0A562WR84_9BACT|nr:ribonuclease HII [Geobacter argillaceus]TWJ32919.1 RNase HII [Geobacter argillaceus]